jgi:hypothetical protein
VVEPPDNHRVAADMPKITYIEHGGREHRVDVPAGLSAMRDA